MYNIYLYFIYKIFFTDTRSRIKTYVVSRVFRIKQVRIVWLVAWSWRVVFRELGLGARDRRHVEFLVTLDLFEARLVRLQVLVSELRFVFNRLQSQLKRALKVEHPIKRVKYTE